MQSTLPIEPLGKAPATADRRYTTFQGRPRPKELNHLFVNNVRFWSMVSIIVVHCTGSFALMKGFHWQLYIAAIAIFKFGTIGFFLISGFLLGERVDRRNPIDYFLARLKRVFRPWLFWFSLTCLILTAHAVKIHGLQNLDSAEIFHLASSEVSILALTSTFWFVPNLLLSIAILLTFRRFLYTLKLGAVLLAANLVYVVNIYTLWFPSQHTQALFAFVFYLWLGSYAAHHFDRLSAALARIPTAVFATAAAITAILAYAESHLLATLHNPDPVNTLRPTNQIFSLFMVLMFFKLGRVTWPRSIDVRRHTFGLYLTHFIVLWILMRMLNQVHIAPLHSAWLADVEVLTIWMTVSALTYFSCIAIASRLAEKRLLEWMVGLTSQDSPRLPNAGSLKPGAFVQT